MDKEKDQEVNWLEAQKIEISVDLLAAAKQQLQFLETVDRHRWLYQGPALERAVYRYNACWLPLLAKYSEAESLVSEGPLVPPLDCEWIWHCHRLNPVRFKSDCEQLYGRVVDNSGVVSSVNGNSKLKTKALWKNLYPEEPYDLDLNKDVSERSSEKHTKYDLVSAAKRQSAFYYQVSRSYVSNEVFLQEAVARYKGFLYLCIKKNSCAPTVDVDLIWHTHLLHPESFSNDTVKLFGEVMGHEETDSGGGKGTKINTIIANTISQWEETFGRRYCKAGAWYRCNAHAPLTTCPFASSSSDVLSKESTEKEDFNNLIQFPEVQVVEVLLEIVGVRNVPDGHQGKLSVVFSKTRPDSLFDAEPRLSILSEAGEKQAACFQCEARGELRFQLLSSSPSKLQVWRAPKSLGSASFSVEEFLSPVVTQLSVEKWLELTPGKADAKPISIRVSLSFTPPTRFPSVLHMVEPKPSWIGSCFVRKSRHAKRWTSVVAGNETELLTLQMSSSDGAALKVIGGTDSGETRVLAECNGTFWSLLESKWSLKLTNADKPVLELSGPRVGGSWIMSTNSVETVESVEVIKIS